MKNSRKPGQSAGIILIIRRRNNNNNNNNHLQSTMCTKSFMVIKQMRIKEKRTMSENKI